MLKREKEQQNQPEKKKEIHNGEILFVTVVFSLLMVAVIWNIVDFMLHDKEEAINNSFNPRQELLASQNIRGSIYSKDGDVLAKTRILADGTEERYYPYQNLFSHVVGYSTKGKTGIEYSENMKLLTSHASISNKIQNELNAEKNIGDSVITTLDVSLQQVAYDALGVYSGAIVVTEPSTGKILAMVSKPDYDPNEIVLIWEDLVEDKSSTVLLNRATQGLYPPGSTFKIVTALEYYRQNDGDISGYGYSCNGHFSKDGSTIRCYHGQNHGDVGFVRSFAKSCNSSFANIGTSLDIAAFQKTCRELLFGSDLKLQLPYNQSQFRLLASDDTDLIMQTSIGQGKTQITPMHLNMITAAIANKGVCMTPYVVDSLESATGAVVKKNTPSEEATMMTEEEAAFMTELMTEVVLSGTASKLDGLSYTAAGKTGSAEFSADKNDSHAWFTGFAPAQDPKVCVTIIVESAGSGGDYAVPIAKRIFDHYFETNS
ncbi:MAG: penicillin-binding protein 2 [Lachnospiraceae bacterium]|nr:penicillin-binding protein 2 [Lachnospiraceae bacterium]